MNKKSISDIENMSNEELLKHVIKTGIEKKIITTEEVAEIDKGLKSAVKKNYDLSEFLPSEETPKEDED
jgi:hypothetical protein